MPVFPTIGSRTADPSDIATSVASTLPRNSGADFVDTAAIGATGVLHLTAIDIPYLANGKVTSISYRSGAQAAVTPTAWWFALYTSARVLVAQTPDQTSTAWAANTTKTVALSPAYDYLSFAPGMYYVGIMMAAATIINTIAPSRPSRVRPTSHRSSMVPRPAR